MAAFSTAWDKFWSACPPVVPLLRHRFASRLVRFHTLPEGKRYPTSDAEHAEILHRHRTLLKTLMGDAAPGRAALIAITCSWSETSARTPRDHRVAVITPRARHWRSDDRATEPGFHSWQHHYASTSDLNDPALDQLLWLVATDWTDDVILIDAACTWAFHPYDGGADVFVIGRQEREHLADAYAAWLAASGKASFSEADT
jgi:hypothetical protein